LEQEHLDKDITVVEIQEQMPRLILLALEVAALERLEEVQQERQVDPQGMAVKVFTPALLGQTFNAVVVVVVV
jgi:hypothetical protein